MASSLYNQTIPIFKKNLRNLSNLLTKATKYADEKNISHEKIIQFRLIEDMRPLTYQVQSCCDTTKFLAQRLAGIEKVVIADDETTFEQLQGRISRTLEILERVKPEDLNASTEKPIIMETKSAGNFKFESGQSYTTNFAIPNLHFHLSTAYCLLRHQGVPIDAMDYLGADTFVKE